MTLSSFLNLFVRLTFLLLTFLALRDLWRHRDRARLGVAAMFGSLAVAILAGRLQPRSDMEARLLQRVVVLGLITHPYLLLRLVSIFRPVSKGARWFSIGGLALCWLLILFSPAPITFPVLLLIIAYFAYVEGYAAVLLLRGARNSGGVSRWRLLLIAAGTIMLTAAILTPTVTNSVPSLTTLGQPIFLVLASAAAATYYLGFATPRWLQRTWQLAELDRFLRQAAGGRIDRTTKKTLDDVCRAATRAIGGVTAVAVAGEKAENTPAVVASDKPRLAVETISMGTRGAAPRAWRSHEPALASTPEEFGLAEAELLEEVTGARALLAVPIKTSVHAPALLLVLLYGRPLFADDDLALLQLYAEHTAVTLDNISLLAEQRELVEKLKQNEAQLEELVAERTAELSKANEQLLQEAAERRRVADALRQSEERYRLLTESALTGVYLIQDGRFPYVNPALAATFGYEVKEIVGRLGPMDLTAPEDRTLVAEKIRSRMDGEASDLRYAFRGLRKDESVIDVEVHGVRVEYEGRPAIVGTLVDVTERRRAEQALRRLNEELEQRVRARTAQLEVANKELESFAYSVSHDLRAPLRAIDGFSQALLEDCSDQIDDLGQEYLARVRANTQRMGELIDALLLLSRLSRAETVMEPVDLSALANSISAELKQHGDARHVEFLIEPGLLVEGDARLLRVVMENLMGNAWKFTAKRSEACIEFGAVEEDGEQVYFVRDNGVGFDMAYADKLFGAFQRLHSINEFSGTGIGLATVQRVIHRHRGRVWAEAAPDRGATFFFTLAAQGEVDGE